MRLGFRRDIIIPHQESALKMAEWVVMDLESRETLQCDKCSRFVDGGGVYLSIDPEDGVVNTMCTTCWKKEVENR